ncbi:MAG TPA: precorrin-2 C(20)-methyltransferase [Bauldia sp.]|nr:precorrin-2 C(20)-methyltransferase [Bauldia sp.]
MSKAARLIGVGVGPGDPELMTLKAVRALREADVVAHFAKAGRAGNARAIASAHMRPGAVELPLRYPVTTEIPTGDPAYSRAIDAFFDASANIIAAHLDEGRTVAVLSEGDPLFYGSYMHLHFRLSHRYPTEVIPGVTSLSGCWSAAGLPLARGDDVLSVIPGTIDSEALSSRLAGPDAVAIIKVCRHIGKIRRAVEGSGRLAGAAYVERGTMEDARIMPLAEKTDDGAPYFAVVLVPARGRPS